MAAGGEDDLIAVYSVADRYLVAHCEGHNSWVSRVVFDPWLDSTCCASGHTSFSGAAPPAAAAAAGTGTSTGGSGSTLGSLGGIAKTSYGSSLVGAGTIYRLASVGQDATLCLWDVQIQLVEGDLFAMPVVANTMRCVRGRGEADKTFRVVERGWGGGRVWGGAWAHALALVPCMHMATGNSPELR